MKTLVSKLFVLLGAVALVVISITGTLFLTRPAGYLSIDVNPSVEFSFNRLNRVVEAKGLNPEAIALLGGEDFKGIEIDDAVREVVFALLENDYLSHEEAMLLFSADEREASNEVLQRIKNEAVVWLKDYETTNLVSQSTNLNDDEIEFAHELGMSAGKYNLVKTIINNSQGITTGTLMDMSIGELMQFAYENQIALNMFDDEQDKQDDKDGHYEKDDMDDVDDYVDSSSLIGSERAKEIAYLHAVIDPSMVFDLEVDLDEEDGRMIFEIEFKAGNIEFEYDIDAISGEIVKWEQDRQDDMDDQNDDKDNVDDQDNDRNDDMDDMDDQDDDRNDDKDDVDDQDDDQNGDWDDNDDNDDDDDDD